MNEGPRFSLGKLRAYLVTLVIICICVRIVWWAVAPLLPILIVIVVVGGLLSWIISIAVYKSHKL